MSCFNKTFCLASDAPPTKRERGTYLSSVFYNDIDDSIAVPNICAKQILSYTKFVETKHNSTLSKNHSRVRVKCANSYHLFLTHSNV